MHLARRRQSRRRENAKVARRTAKFGLTACEMKAQCCKPRYLQFFAPTSRHRVFATAVARRVYFQIVHTREGVGNASWHSLFTTPGGLRQSICISIEGDCAG